MIERLVCKLGRNDEVPNTQLAEELCQSRDSAGIGEIVGGLLGKDKAIANDCIKVLYEVGERQPELIASYADEFIACLRSKNNRLVWGGMKALAQIASLAPQQIFENLQLVLGAYKNGSVITVDHSISVFASLCQAGVQYEKAVLPIIIDHLETCGPEKAAQHAERAAVCFNRSNAVRFTGVLEQRLPHLAPPGQARVNKLLKKLRDHASTSRKGR